MAHVESVVATGPIQTRIVRVGLEVKALLSPAPVHITSEAEGMTAWDSFLHIRNHSKRKP